MPARSTALLQSAATEFRALPGTVGELAEHELVAHCDRCGRHLRLYPGHADFPPRTPLGELFRQIACRARHRGEVCGGTPRRLLLIDADRRWILDLSGEWAEDDSALWEEADFPAVSRRNPRRRR